jgi:hypothetical protein
MLSVDVLSVDMLNVFMLSVLASVLILFGLGNIRNQPVLQLK